MTTARYMSVEKQLATISIVGNCPIKPELQEIFSEQNLKYLEDSSDLDYLIVWDQEVPQITANRILLVHPYQKWENHLSFANARHIFLGSLFGPTQLDTLLLSFAEEAKQHGRITLPKDGVGKYHLLSTKDAAAAIVKATIHPRANPTIYLLGQEYSLLSLAYHLRSAYPSHLNIIFDEKKPWNEPNINWDQLSLGLESLNLNPSSNQSQLNSHLALILTAPKTTISRAPTPTSIPTAPPKPRLQKFVPPPSPTRAKTSPSIFKAPIISKPKPRKIEFEPIVPVPKPRRIPQKRSFKQFKTPKIITLLSQFGLIFIIGTFIYLSSIMLSVLLMVVGVRSMAQTLTSSTKAAESSYTSSKIAASYLKANVVAFADVLPKNLQLADLSRLIDSTTQFFNLSRDLQDLKKTLTSMGSAIFSQTDPGTSNLVSDTNQARILVESVYEQLSLITGTLPSAYPQSLPSRYESQYQNLIKELSLAKNSILKSKAILTVLPDLVGIGERKKYALLLQNNMELRPTGGFIGSFAILSLDNGRLYDLPVYDVYQADGQLKGHIEPPLPIRKYLGEANWYLRDSNWDPNFQTTSERVEWYLKKTMNFDVDGVIGINLNTIQSILRVLGQLEIPEYGEVITPANLFERTEYHAEVGFFPGSTQKKEFLAALSTALLARLSTSDSTTLTQVMLAIIESADQGDLQLSSTQENVQTVFQHLGWSGALKSGDCGLENCLNSYLSVVDANVGVNKANYFLRRELSLKIDFDSNLNAVHALTIATQNTATTSTWPAGSYKNYQRLYLPQGAELLSLKRDGIEVPARDIDISNEHAKTSIGYLVTTPIAGNSQVVATYRLNAKTSLVSPNFSFYWQKQPGTFNDPLTVTINYPSFLSPAIISPEAELSEGSLVFSLSNISDRRVGVSFNTIN